MVRKGWKLEVRNTTEIGKRGGNRWKSKVGFGVNCEAGTLLETAVGYRRKESRKTKWAYLANASARRKYKSK
jgi:hypothetical protein